MSKYAAMSQEWPLFTNQVSSSSEHIITVTYSRRNFGGIFSFNTHDCEIQIYAATQNILTFLGRWTFICVVYILVSHWNEGVLLAPIANKTSDDMVQALVNISPFKLYLHVIIQ